MILSYNEKFERKLMILVAAGMKVMVLREKDLGRGKGDNYVSL